MTRTLRLAAFGAAAIALGLVAISDGPAAAAEVNVYSTRQPFLIDPIFEAFTDATGIAVNTVYIKQGLIERLRREGRNSPADLILTVDVGRLSDAKGAGVTQAVEDPMLNEVIPRQYRDSDGHWFGLTTRARVIYAAKDRVAPGDIRRYEDLADPKWRGRVCTRSGGHEYQVGLIAAMIAHHGADGARRWLAGVKANLARRPQGNDRSQVRAIKEGLCDLALGNSYYYGNMLQDAEQAEWARAVNVVFPNQGDRGTHVNLSGVALTQSAPNRAEAVRLMRFLVSEAAQRMYAERNFEYPIRQGVPWSDLLTDLGDFLADGIDLAKVAAYRPAAIRLVNEVDYDG